MTILDQAITVCPLLWIHERTHSQKADKNKCLCKYWDKFEGCLVVSCDQLIILRDGNTKLRRDEV